MNSESEKQLSLEELRQRNLPQQLPPPAERHPTAQEWLELSTSVTAMGKILAEQLILLEERSEHQGQSLTRAQAIKAQAQLEEVTAELKAIRHIVEQAGKKKERRSFPRLYLPELPKPSLMWLIPPAILLVSLAACYSLATLWNGLTTLFP